MSRGVVRYSRLLIPFATLSLCFVSASPALAESCSCRSASCSASISCSGGCWAICGSTCTAGCSGGGGGGGPLYPSPDPGLPNPLDSLSAPIRLELSAASAADAALQLSSELGQAVRFLAEGEVNLEAKGLPALELLRALSSQGAVIVLHDEGNQVRLGEARVSVFSQTTFPDRVSEILTTILNRPTTFLPFDGSPMAIEVKNTPVHQLLQALATQGEIRFGS